MKKLLLLVGLFVAYTSVNAQTLDADLKAKQAELEAAQKTVDDLTAAVSDLESQIEKGAGWISGYSGLVGFDFNKSNGWIANPNPDASSSALNLGINAFANNIKDDFFWRNKGILTKSWADIDLSNADGSVDDDGLFDNGTVDILNISSLAGKPLSDSWALSGLGELNTSLSNFLEPGTLDVGVGLTWTPDIDDLIVVIHPLNYRFAFSGLDGVESSSTAGAKIRADFNRDFGLGGRAFKWSSTLTSFVPYSDKATEIPAELSPNGEAFTTGLFEYTWLNTLSFEVWKGIGVGISHGLRSAKFETPDLQSFYTVGLSYAY